MPIDKHKHQQTDADLLREFLRVLQATANDDDRPPAASFYILGRAAYRARIALLDLITKADRVR